MSKRNAEKASNKEPAAKRLRISLSSEKGLLTLSQDELRSIVEFLPVGEVLMLCLTCQSLHEEIVAILRNMAPFVAQKPWTISKAYAARNQFELWTPQDVIDLCGALDNQTLHKIPSNLSINVQDTSYVTDITKDDLKQLLGAESGKTEIRQVVKVDWTDDSIKTSMHDGDPDYDHVFEKIEEKVAVTRGFEVKKLELNSEVLPRMDVYRILSQCPNLDTLELQITEDAIFRLSKMKRMEQSVEGDDDPENDQSEANTEGVTIPVMNELKLLKITSCYDWDAGMQFIVDILQLCPNLESLFYEYHKQPNDQFLDFLATQCPKLKVLSVEGDDGATPVENEFTDEGILRFLDKLPEMNTLLLYHCCNVSGEVFTKIGKYSKLKTLCITRVAMNGDLVDQYDNVHFGGGVLTELETLAMEGMYESLPDNFGESLAATAPNLKNLFNHIDVPEAHQQLSKVMLPKLAHANVSGRFGNNLSGSVSNDLDTRIQSNLESVDISSYENNILSVEYIKKANWGNMKNMKISCVLPDAPDQWLRAIVNSCPRMEVFHLTDHVFHPVRDHALGRRKIFVEALLQVLADPTLWPNLSILDVSAINQDRTGREDAPQLQSQILRLRPLLVLTEPAERTGRNVEHTEQEFIYNWLALEPVRASSVRSRIGSSRNLLKSWVECELK